MLSGGCLLLVMLGARKVVKSLEPSEPGNIELEVPVHDKLEIQHKKSLIFLLLLITYVLTIFIIRKFKF